MATAAGPVQADESVRLEDPAGEVIAAVLEEPGLRGLAAELLGPSWVLVTNRHNHAVIDHGGGSRGTRMHRDLLHWSRSPITLLLMLDCAPDDPQAWPSLIPGSHLWPTSEPSNGGGYWLDEAPEPELAGQAVKVPMNPGDVLVMDGMTYHSAGLGSPDRARVMVTLCLRTPDELTGEAGPNEQLVAGSIRYEGQPRWRRNG
ncbi:MULTISPECIES: phytanoyl-CoA dioxygenase family protein [unclassified Kribbella]|uniref:phytanoyl-CoA dioxygenase family protein n=1 Tax=unclassified Kribbella TaxID=2644121 RepID=UPI003405DCD0